MSPRTLSAGIILSLFLGILLLWLSPEDRTLGSLLKLVYLHGALINTGIILFTAAGLISVFSLLRNRAYFSLLFAIEKTAIIFWVAATITGNVTSILAWGGLFWGEPRFNATVIISLASISIYLISTAAAPPKAAPLLGAALAVAVWVLMVNAGRIMHPDNPFATSGLPIKTFFVAITMLFFLSSVLIVRLISKKDSQ